MSKREVFVIRIALSPFDKGTLVIVGIQYLMSWQPLSTIFVALLKLVIAFENLKASKFSFKCFMKNFKSIGSCH